jgi:serine/threonine protein phosphatase PrpC
MSNVRGGRDNISVILVRAHDSSQAERPREDDDQGFLGWLKTKMGS